jgi:hypothetical protein
MGFFNKLFDSKNQELYDGQLGVFKKISKNGSLVIWEGTAQFLNEAVSIFLNGTETDIDESQKKELLNILKYSSMYSEKCNEILKVEFENADKSYSTWAGHFDCIAISILNNEPSISFEEKETQYHFNVIFEGDIAVGVAIDS